MQDSPHDRRVDPVDEFDVADPRREDEPEPATDGLFVAGHRGEQRVDRKPRPKDNPVNGSTGSILRSVSDR